MLAPLRSAVEAPAPLHFARSAPREVHADFRALAPRDLRYLGLIGSRAKVARIYEALADDHMPPDALARVHAPIGLDIGAVTPQEIAVSILAELIAVKHGKDDPRPLRWLPPQLARQSRKSEVGS